MFSMKIDLHKWLLLGKGFMDSLLSVTICQTHAFNTLFSSFVNEVCGWRCVIGLDCFLKMLVGSGAQGAT